MSEQDIIKLLEDLRDKKLNVITITRRPLRHYKHERDINKVYDMYPQFSLCLLSKCPQINNCWDVKKHEWKQIGSKNCILKDFWLGASFSKKGILNYRNSYKVIFSNYELGLILALVRELYSYDKSSKVKELLEKLEKTQVLSGYYIER